MTVFNVLTLSFSDPALEQSYRKVRGKWSREALAGILITAVLGFMLHRKALWLILQAASLALGCLLTSKGSPYLSLGVFAYLHYLLLTHLSEDFWTLLLWSFLQILPGSKAYSGQVAARVLAGLGASAYWLVAQWRGSVGLEEVAMIVGVLLAHAGLVVEETLSRLRFAYKDYSNSGESVYQTMITVIDVPLAVVRPYELIYCNDTMRKVLRANTLQDASRRLTSFQLQTPGLNLSFGRNQPLWSDVNTALRGKNTNAILRKYVYDDGKVTVSPIGKVIVWEGAPALLITFSPGGQGEVQGVAATSVRLLEDLRQRLNDIHASAKVLRAVHSEPAYDELERSVLCQYYQVYTLLDLADIASGRPVTLRPQPVIFGEEIQKIIDTFQPQAKEKAVTLQVNTSPSLPGHIAIDFIRMKQLLYPALSLAISNSKRLEVILIEFSEGTVSGQRELSVKIAYKAAEANHTGSLPDISPLYRAAGSKGLAIAPGSVSFSMTCGELKGRKALGEDDLQVSSDEEHKAIIPTGLRNRGKT